METVSFGELDIILEVGDCEVAVAVLAVGVVVAGTAPVVGVVSLLLLDSLLLVLFTFGAARFDILRTLPRLDPLTPLDLRRFDGLFWAAVRLRSDGLEFLLTPRLPVFCLFFIS